MDASTGLPRPGDGTRLGTPSKPEPDKARGLFTRACELGYSHACAEAARPLLATTRMNPTPVDEAEGIRLLTHGCELSHEFGTAVDGRWISCLQLALFQGAEGRVAEAEKFKQRGCSLSKGGCLTLPDGGVAAWSSLKATSAEGDEPAQKDSEASHLRGMDTAYFDSHDRADPKDRESLTSAALWTQGYFERALPRITSADSESTMELLLAYDNLMRASRVPGLSGKDISSDAGGYAQARLGIHMQLGRMYGTESE